MGGFANFRRLWLIQFFANSEHSPVSVGVVPILVVTLGTGDFGKPKTAMN